MFPYLRNALRQVQKRSASMEKENADSQIPRQWMAFTEPFIMPMETTTLSMAQSQQKMHGETFAIDTRHR